jgi:Flp pilus assembly protein TadG
MPKPSQHKRESMSGSRGFLRRFLRDERGIAALYIGLSSVLLLGATALAFDLARVMSLQTELQSAADAAALAGAAELDRQTGAISRAKAAAGCPNGNATVQGAFGTNSQTFANDGNGTSVTVVFCVFFSSLTTPDGALLPPNTSAQGGSSTTTDNNAAFIKVVVQQRSLANAFITVVGGQQMASTIAAATAGQFTITCKPLQLMICNPNEPAGFNPKPGQELFMSYAGGQFQAPGNWGLMDAPPVVSAASQACGVVPGGNGSPVIEAYLGSTAPIGCFSTDLLVTRPGKPTPVAPALNALLDMYDGLGGDPLSSTGPKAACYPPAPNVVKGYYNTAGSGCPNTGPVNNGTAMAFPQDSNEPGTLQGNGNWDITTYWTNNHGGAAPADIQSVATTYANANGLPAPGPQLPVTGNTYGATIPSRYATYLYEIAKPAIDVANTPTGHMENGAPACYKTPTDPNITPARRLLNVGIVNCTQQGVGGRSAITPGSMLQAFMILPADGGGSNPANPGIYLEVVKQVQADTGDGILHTVVQLYR